jgi:murein DD-endopeptidase MepM/ murein hydrolase activator NlpD
MLIHYTQKRFVHQPVKQLACAGWRLMLVLGLGAFNLNAAYAAPNYPTGDTDRVALPRFNYAFKRHVGFGVTRDFPASNLNDQPIDCYAFDVTELSGAVPLQLVGPHNQLKFLYPVKGHKTSGFGPRGGRFHYGTDFALEVGDTVVSAMDGLVRIVRVDRLGYGNFIVVAHAGGLETLYGHLSAHLVTEGQRVSAGEVIGLGGSTGRSTGPHLHFETRYMGEQFNPEYVMRLQDSTVTGDTLYVTAGLFRHLDRFPHRTPQDRYVPDEPQLAHQHEDDHHHATPATAHSAQGGGSQASGTPTSLAGARAHVVRTGDTLGAIATRYGTTVSRLCQLNGIAQTTLLQIGQRIRLP